MCGIYGIVNLDGSPPDEELVRAMGSVLAHRGPDAVGMKTLPGVCLGHRRLSIIDLAGSAQPMSTPEDDLHITFNGEILNYRTLRDELRGFTYRTNGDTEVLLALWRAAGVSGLTRLRGQYAMAVHDARAQTTWLARDPAGILPLYYLQTPTALIFASEIKAILQAAPHHMDLDTDSLSDYLRGRAVPAPWTMYRDVRKLKPGHTLKISRGSVSGQDPFWIPREHSSAQRFRRLADRDAVDLVADSLQTAVERNFEADVPVGAFLSGGLDSSLIVALATKRRQSHGLHTFAAGFVDSPVSELGKARGVAALLATDHHEAELGAADFTDLWGRLSWFRDAPVSEASDVAVYVLAKMAADYVKVALSGEGADELFGGYPKYALAGLTRHAGVLPHRARAAAVSGVARLGRGPASRRFSIAAGALAEPLERERYLSWFAPFTTDEVQCLLARTDPRDNVVSDVALAGDSLTRMLAVDFACWLPDNLLERADRMAMASSLEVRPPYLDLDVIALAQSLPSKFKVRGRTRKWVLREVARRHLPDPVIDQTKIGFTVPMNLWLKGRLRDFAYERFLDQDSLVQNHMSAPTVLRYLDEHVTGRHDHSNKLWTLLSLEVWYAQFRKDRAELGERC